LEPIGHLIAKCGSQGDVARGRAEDDAEAVALCLVDAFEKKRYYEEAEACFGPDAW
jgi:hypothetical protein